MSLSDLRCIYLSLAPATLRHYIEPTRALIRPVGVPWRGPAVFTNDEAAWAVTNVLDIVPCLWRPGQHLWRISEVIWLPEPIPYRSSRQATFKGKTGEEPLFASANLCRDLEALLGCRWVKVPRPVPQAQPVKLAPTPVEEVGPQVFNEPARSPEPEAVAPETAVQHSLFDF